MGSKTLVLLAIGVVIFTLPWATPRHIANLEPNRALSDNVLRRLKDIEFPNQNANDNLDKKLSMNEYHRYDTIMRHLQSQADRHPQFVEMSIIGKTWEDRAIPLVKIGTSPQGSRTRAIWFDAGIHAREWIAPATAMYLVDRLIENFDAKQNGKLDRLGQDKDIVDDLTAVDWYFVPLANPDGYEFSHETNRLWRKNRSPAVEGSDCQGVDLNRNFDVVGFGVGASNDSCSDTYSGRARNSEPEVRALTENLMKRRNNVRISMSLHSHGNLWLTSWGYKKVLPVDNDKMITLGNEAAKAMERVNGRVYKVGAAGVIFYPAGGASDDFAKAKALIPYAVTLELPGDEFGFELPADRIQGVGDEVWESMSLLANAAAAEPLGDDVYHPLELARDLKLEAAERAAREG